MLPNTKQNNDGQRCLLMFLREVRQLEDNRQQQRLLLNPKYFENFDNDTKRMLEEKSKVLRWVVDKVPDLRDIEDCRAVVVDYRKDTLRWYKLISLRFCSNRERIVRARKEIESRILTESDKRIMCGQAERLCERLDEIFPECLRILKTEACHYGFTNFSNARSHYQDLIKQYKISKDCGNRTSLVSTTATGDKDPNDETVIETGN